MPGRGVVLRSRSLTLKIHLPKYFPAFELGLWLTGAGL